ncbi:MAG: phosphopantetheine-binding protein [Lachnoclostridium sp.]|nr:phosphopantetheine-binding protein [Lachnospira sp.]MCM1248922.1 phosphopantetheine-binding protein [Lachnoclostridium sp.]
MINVDERVIKVIGEVANTGIVVQKGMALNKIGYDSLKNVELAVLLEEEFDIRFDDSMLSQSRFSTVDSVIALVVENIR